MKAFITWIIIFIIIGLISSMSSWANVIAVIDGDTIVVSEDGESFTVRMIGIDTPEKGECGYQEAKDYLKEIITEKVHLSYDRNKEKEGYYWRQLMYVSGFQTDFNKEMILAGWAEENAYGSFYTRHRNYLSAQRKAQEENLGIWKLCE